MFRVAARWGLVGVVGWLATTVGPGAAAQPAAAKAPAVVFEQSVRVGKPALAARVRIVPGAEGRTQLELGNTKLALEVPVEASWQASEVRGAGGRSLALLSATAGARSFAVVLGTRAGRTQVLFSGELTLRGDPGERTGQRVQVDDLDGDGASDVIVGRYQEGRGVCGQPPALFEARQLDGASGALAPVVLDALRGRTVAAQADAAAGANASAAATVGAAHANANTAKALTASAESPGPTGTPLLSALRAVASSRRAAELDPGLSAPPRAAVDGQLGTAWEGEPGAGARSQFVTLRWEAGAWPMRALAVVLTPDAASVASTTNASSAPAANGSSTKGAPSAPKPTSSQGATSAAGKSTAPNPPTAPEKLWLVGEAGAPLEVELPREVATRPGAPLWIALPEAWSGRCLSVVLEGKPRGPGSALGLAEVRAYTELDFAGGVQALVAELSSDGKRAADAAELLAQVETSSAAALLDAWPRLSALGRSRAVRVFAGQARRDPQALVGLERALRQAGKDDAMRTTALQGLLAAGAAGVAQLRSVIAEPNETGDAAADALARARPAQASGALLAALDADGGSERTRLRGALALTARDPSAVTAMQEFFAQSRAVHVETAAAFALSTETTTQPLALVLVQRNLARAEEFADLWRIVLAAEALPASRELDGWLEVLARTDERWMLRDRALSTLTLRDPDRAVRLARELLGDEYPRVRATAVGVLGAKQADSEAVALRARRDRWPLVRAAALDALNAPGDIALPRAALTDRSRAVRAAAVRGLTRLEDRGAEALVIARLTDDKEWPEVQHEAVTYAQALCVQAAAEPLAKVAQRGLLPNAWDPHVELAMRALQAMTRLGGSAEQTALQLARAQPGGQKLAESFEAGAKAAGKCPLPR